MIKLFNSEVMECGTHLQVCIIASYLAIIVNQVCIIASYIAIIVNES